MNKVSNKAKRELFGQMLNKYKENNVMTWTNFQNAHFRVFTPNKTIDFYINSMRWHDIRNNLRGDLITLQDFTSFIEEKTTFKIDTKKVIKVFPKLLKEI
jgi:hypothetical protein